MAVVSCKSSWISSVAKQRTQFLKTIKRTGLKKGLFYEWRFRKDDQGKDQETDFVLNVEPWREAEILIVTGDNFGCGSSREHAPWALKDLSLIHI